MELILLQKVVNLGGLGDKVRVKPGYGRNFLIPYGQGRAGDREERREFRQARGASQGERHPRRRSPRPSSRCRSDAQANSSTEGKLYGSVGRVTSPKRSPPLASR